MIRVLIADDHPIIRRGLREIVSAEADLEVAGEAGNAVEALTALRGGGFDVVLMDITMPGRSGLEALKDIRVEFPALPVLMLSIHPEDQYAVRALKAGASGYLTKESAPEELVGAIQRVVRGGRYVSGALAERLAAEIGGAERPDEAHAALSDREFEVLVLIGRGRGVSQIAADLCLSVKTVSTYRTRILEKLGLESTADLIRYVIEKGLAD